MAVHISRFVLLVLAVLANARVFAADEGQQATDGNLPDINAIRVGIADHFKVGHWTPIRVSVDGLTPLKDPHVIATAPDNDGVPTVATVPLPLPTMPDADRVATVYTNVGRIGAPIDVALATGTRAVESQSLKANGASAESKFVELPATAELVLFMGPASPELTDSYTKRNPANGQPVGQAVRVESVNELPDKWFGYDAVDLVILTVGDGDLFGRQYAQLATDEKRFDALVQWVELGGRLVVFCGGENAQAVFGEDRPMATLLPGKLSELVRLPETGRLEHFANSEAPIAGRGARVAIVVPRLVDVEGNIEVFAGQRPTDLPLVVRSARGLGEIMFVGVDLTKPPLADWPGRAAFLQALLKPYLADDDSGGATQKLVTRGYNDLSGALRQRLGRSFSGVAPITFSLVTVFAIAYLLVVGPLDYFVVQRWLKRTWAGWFTFPLIVLLFGGMALALADWRHGSGNRRVNQLELVDIDTISGQARGTVWSAVFSPHADQLNLRLDVEPFAGGTEKAAVLVSSWPLPGAGIGGTQASGLDLAIAGDGYHYASDLSGLDGVPVLTSGTKSFLARWTAPAGLLVDAELVDDDGLVAGSIENRMGKSLRNVRLFYNGWGYRLGNVDGGERIDVREELSPRSMKTIVTQDALGSAASGRSEENVFVAERASLKEIFNLMMFYEAAGGFGFAQLPNRFQAYCDLSRVPDLGRAVLVADVKTAGSRLVDSQSGEPIGDGEPAAVVYRFVLPVRNNSN